MDRIRVLFVCVHNAARSQMAEAFLNAMGADRFQAASAGLEPMAINPLVVEAMGEVGLDLSGRTGRSVFELFRAGELFDYVITVCDEAAGERCPIFPGITKRLHWSFPDPSRLEGGREKMMEGVREIRDQIKAQVAWWMAQAAASRPGVGAARSPGRGHRPNAQPPL